MSTGNQAPDPSALSDGIVEGLAEHVAKTVFTTIGDDRHSMTVVEVQGDKCTVILSDPPPHRGSDATQTVVLEPARRLL